MQKSQKGLLRTLLYECLVKVPHLLPRVCPKRWALAKLFGRHHIIARDWGWHGLLEAMNNLALESGKRAKFALFIDGLDEFDGDHDELVGSC